MNPPHYGWLDPARGLWARGESRVLGTLGASSMCLMRAEAGVDNLRTSRAKADLVKRLCVGKASVIAITALKGSAARVF